MNSKLLSFLKYLDVSPEEIDELYAVCPNIFEYDADKISDNITLVISCGYPKSDIGNLLLANPNFVFDEHEHLKRVLLSLGEDVETKLNKNPFLI